MEVPVPSSAAVSLMKAIATLTVTRTAVRETIKGHGGRLHDWHEKSRSHHNERYDPRGNQDESSQRLPNYDHRSKRDQAAVTAEGTMTTDTIDRRLLTRKGDT